MDLPRCSQNYVITIFIGVRAMDTCRTSFGNIQHLIEINETLQLKVPPRMLSTLFVLMCLGSLLSPCEMSKERQRFPTEMESQALPSSMLFLSLSIPQPPPSQRSRVRHPTEVQKELVVRRTIFSSDLCRISGHQKYVSFFVQHLLISTTEARVTPLRCCKKKGPG